MPVSDDPVGLPGRETRRAWQPESRWMRDGAQGQRLQELPSQETLAQRVYLIRIKLDERPAHPPVSSTPTSCKAALTAVAPSRTAQNGVAPGLELEVHPHGLAVLAGHEGVKHAGQRGWPQYPRSGRVWAVIQIRTPRLTLRPFVAQDESVVMAYKNDPEVARFQGWRLPFTQEHFLRLLDPTRRLAESGWVSRAICDSTGVCGDVGLREHDRQAEVGITLASSAQGRGYAIEALSGITRHAFVDLGLHRLHAGIDPANDGVKRLFSRAGWRHEGTTVQSYWHRGRWADDATYALLRDEWLASNVQ